MAKFKLSSTENTNFNTPQQMFDDYKNRTIDSIFNYQSDMIDLYLKEEKDVKDIALELPTGTGKTLIGLLIGEFRRRKNKEKILYLCPNKQLVNQTVRHSIEDYGIKATAFNGKVKDYSPADKLAYTRAETIAVAPYSSLFNCNPFFADADIIIFDDAHSGESYVASNWTINIDREKDSKLYFTLADNFQTYLEKELYERMLSPSSEADKYWFDMIPNINMVSQSFSISKIFNDYISNAPDTQVRYGWSMLQSHINACNIFISCGEIVIRPFIPPTLDFSPFKNAKQRIYMSATLGKSGELERSFGVPEIKKLPMVKDWENKTIGRRFFMFPLASFTEDKLREILLAIINKVNRSMIIVNDDRTQSRFKELVENDTDRTVFTAKDIESSKKNFVESDKAVAIIANRFDGIDFPNEECRMEILFDLQSATHIQEKFLTTRMCSTVLFAERIRTRLVQALGRCTRGNTDYAAVCIVGDDLMNALISPKQLNQFNPELQAELQFGLDNSTGHSSIEEYLELLDLFINNRNEWNVAEKDIINRREDIIRQFKVIDDTPFKQLNDAGKFEIQAQYSIWREAYADALTNIEKVCGTLQHESLRGYLGFWYYMAAYCAYNLYFNGDTTYKPIYSSYLKKASSTTLSIKWFNKLVDMTDDDKSSSDMGVDHVLEKMESFMARTKSKQPNTKSIYEELDKLLNDITFGSGIEFEKAHELLGKWLGYRTTNPPGDSEPDPIWILNHGFCIVSEDKIYETADKAVPTRHVREAAGHLNWVKSHYQKLGVWETAEVVCVFLTNASTIEETAVAQANGIFYLNRNTFIDWSKRCVDMLKELITSFNTVGDVVWRDKAVRLMVQNKLTPADYIQMIKASSLESLTVKKNTKEKTS